MCKTMWFDRKKIDFAVRRTGALNSKSAPFWGGDLVDRAVAWIVDNLCTALFTLQTLNES